MKLWQDPAVVKALQHILADHLGFEYDEKATKSVRCDMLKVKVPDSSPKRTSVGQKISSELSKTTRRNFIHANPLSKSQYLILMELENGNQKVDPTQAGSQ